MSDPLYDLVARLELDPSAGELMRLTGFTLHTAERLDRPRRYLLAVLRAIVEQLEALETGA
jgi:hypothetical protein